MAEGAPLTCLWLGFPLSFVLLTCGAGVSGCANGTCVTQEWRDAGSDGTCVPIYPNIVPEYGPFSFYCGCSAGFWWNSTSGFCEGVCGWSHHCMPAVSAASCLHRKRTRLSPVTWCVAATAALLPADIPACLWNPCTVGIVAGQTTCHDLPAPALNNTAGRSCDCSAPGYFYTEEQGCQGKSSV